MSFYQAGDFPQRCCNCGPYGSIIPPPPCPMHGCPPNFGYGTPVAQDLVRRIAELERRLAERLDDEPVKAGLTD